MMAKLTVREAHVADADLVRGHLYRAFGEYDGRLDPPSGAHRETSSSLAGRIRRGGALVCEAGAVAVGCAFYEPAAGFLYVGRFGVVPEYRGRGVGPCSWRRPSGAHADRNHAHAGYAGDAR